ncbi:MAG: carbon starvation protein A [Muribaculaceae bacterium]|nr:carbon starvation protein A [Muribaculaceae bacterium]
MVTFIISLLALILGYLVYGAVMERVMRPDDRETPALRLADGVDYVALPTWKVFMIQFLNIAGTGPIFGAIMGMWFGPASYLWIVLGCIFAGAVHDFMSGMLSLRNDGANLPTLIGKYLGGGARNVMLVFTVLLLMMVGAVFVYSPALILGGMFPKESIMSQSLLWIVVIFAYYVVATLLPIDKIIGRIYPLFAIALLVMAAGLLVGLFVKMPHLPELWDMGAMDSWRQSQAVNGKDVIGVVAFMQKNPLFPCLFITIACGAISGFHATQSPLMARCLKSERLARPVFYGAMITEGLVALIWATVSSYFFYYGGWKEVVSPEKVTEFMAQVELADGKTLIQYFTAPQVVNIVCSGWLGIVGGTLAILGVVAAPITSGDTAFRSARLIIAESLHFEQKSMVRRLMISVPLFVASLLLLIWQMENPDGFNVLWQYFGWSNQALSVFTLWMITVYLARERKAYIITLIPAIFMTVVCTSFLVASPQAIGQEKFTPWVALAVIVIAIVWFSSWLKKERSTARLTRE